MVLDRSKFIHHRDPSTSAVVREIIFGLEDGMVSTLGAVTGIAAATSNQAIVILSGLVIISVESVSMAVGSYLSSKSQLDIDKRKLFEEKSEIHHFPDDEKQELAEMYVADGWTKKTANVMAEEASQNHKLFLQEMAYRELRIIPENLAHPLRNGLLMGGSYIVGGTVPLLTYLFLPLFLAIQVSVVSTFLALFVLGVLTTRFTRRKWWKAGLEMFGLACLAAAVGYLVGQVVDFFWLSS